MKSETTKMIELALRADESLDSAARARILKLIAADGNPQREQKEPDRIVRRDEVARRLAVSTRMVDMYAKNGVLTRIKMPGQARANGFRASELETLIEGRIN